MLGSGYEESDTNTQFL